MALLAVLGFSWLQNTTTYNRTDHFVLHPNPSMDRALVPQAIAVMENDGPFVQTVLRVLESHELLDQAVTAARLPGGNVDDLSLDATVSPSSAYFDVTVSGPEAAPVRAVGAGLVTAASSYVDRSYPGYELETLGVEDAALHSYPPSTALLLLGLVAGGALGVGIVYLEWAIARQKRLRSVDVEPAAAEAMEPPAVVEVKEPAAAKKVKQPAAAKTAKRPAAAKTAKRPAAAKTAKRPAAAKTAMRPAAVKEPAAAEVEEPPAVVEVKESAAVEEVEERLAVVEVKDPAAG